MSTKINLLCFFLLQVMISVTFLDKFPTTIMAPREGAMTALPHVTDQVVIFVKSFMAFTTFMLLGT